jgi:adenosylhomocysteine nucleosidase
MMLRWLVTQYLRQMAQQKLRESMVDTARQHFSGPASRPGSPPANHESPSEEANFAQPLFERVLSGQAPSSEHATDAGDSPDDPRPAPFVCEAALVFALGIEAGGTIDLLTDARRQRGQDWSASLGSFSGKQVVVAETGVGRSAATRATQALIDQFQPPWIISTGFAGSLSDDVQRGHVLMVDRIVDEQGVELTTGFALDEAARSAARGLHVGRLLTVDRLIRDAEQRRALGVQFSALACDMETLAVAQVCAARKVRFMAIRIISDAVNDILPAEVEKLMESSSLAGKLGVATSALWRRPSLAKDLWKLRETAIETSDRLAKFLTGVVQQLD